LSRMRPFDNGTPGIGRDPCFAANWQIQLLGRQWQSRCSTTNTVDSSDTQATRSFTGLASKARQRGSGLLHMCPRRQAAEAFEGLQRMGGLAKTRGEAVRQGRQLDTAISIVRVNPLCARSVCTPLTKIRLGMPRREMALPVCYWVNDSEHRGNSEH